jgi:lysophospholipase L1-like esterase
MRGHDGGEIEYNEIAAASRRETEEAMNRKPKSRKRKVITVLLCIFGALVVFVACALIYLSGVFLEGNQKKYSAENAEALADSPLRSMRILFLGSSVTHGTMGGESFVEFLEKRDWIVPFKEAVAGTTLVDNGKRSYVARLKTVDPALKFDAFVCQLSTNDATKQLPLGTISADKDARDFDANTIAGSIETIISYVRETWDCPIIFYTGTRYDDEYYGQMVELLLEIQKKWDIGVIDLWNDAELNNISSEDYKLYMINGIHPTRAGYGLWWLPAMEAYLYDCIGQAGE